MSRVSAPGKNLRQRLKRFGVEVSASNGVSTFTFKPASSGNDKTIFNDTDWDSTGKWLSALMPTNKITKQAKPITVKKSLKPKPESPTDATVTLDYGNIARDILSELIPRVYLEKIIGAFVWPEKITLAHDKFIELRIKTGMKDIRLGDYRPHFTDLMIFLAKNAGITYFPSQQMLPIHNKCSPCLNVEKSQRHEQFEHWLKETAIPERQYDSHRFFATQPKVVGPSERLFNLIEMYEPELRDNGFFLRLDQLNYCDKQIDALLKHIEKDQHRLLQCFYKAYAYYLTLAIQRLFDVAGEDSNQQLSVLRHSVRHMRHDSPDLHQLRNNSRGLLHALSIKVPPEDMRAFDDLLANCQHDRTMQVTRKDAMTVIQAEFAFLEEAKAIDSLLADELIIQAAVEHSANFIHQILKQYNLFNKIDARIKAEIQQISQEIGHGEKCPDISP